jgi:predicted membrane protein
LPQVARAAGQGAELFGQATATAAEVMRSRREPSVVAHRRRIAARRRCTAWSIATVILAALATFMAVTVFSGRGDAADVAAMVLAVGLLVWGVLGAVRAGIDLRARTLVVRRLPPPQPRRSAVTSAVRPQMDRLSDYSDRLRELIGLVGVFSDEVPVTGRRRAGQRDSMRAVRDDTLAAADAAETTLRARAAELTALTKMRRSTGEGADTLARARSALLAEIAAGVDGYGRLVVATAQAVAASRELAGSVPQVDRLADATDRLTALAAGMRELAESAVDHRAG